MCARDSGTFATGLGWGTKKNDTSHAWHVLGANSYKQLNYACRGPNVLHGTDGREIHKGWILSVYLQCGYPKNGTLEAKPQRFYKTLAEWQGANPEEDARLGPVILT